MRTVAIIGAGISGLICARVLADHGVRVTVFEKSRGVGGRMATRRTDDGLRFDHGAQYFTARDEHFQKYVATWLDDGIVGRWDGSIFLLERGRISERKTGTERYVAVPGMNAICRQLSQDLDVRLQTLVAPPRLENDRWQIVSDNGQDLGNFDVVVVATPAPQAAVLLEATPQLADRAAAAKMQGCWAVLVAFDTSLNAPFDAAFVDDSPLAWIARNNSKPQRDERPETWVLHASPEWSTTHMEESPTSVRAFIIASLWKATALEPAPVRYSTAHRWRFALPSEPLAEACLFDEEMKLAACGDWCGGPRVEGAFLSGLAAAERILGLFEAGTEPIVG